MSNIYGWITKRMMSWNGRRKRQRVMSRKLFVSYYYFSYILLQEAVPIFAAVIAHNKETADRLTELLTLLQQLDK